MSRKVSKCVIYARYSPRPDEATSDSNDSQIEICRAFAEREGLEVMGVFEDRGKSRDDIERVGVYEAIGMLQDGWLLVCLEPARFGSGYVAMVLEHEVLRKGADVVFTDGTRLDKDDPWAMVIRAAHYAMAKVQQNMVGPRTSAKMKQHMRDGRKMGGKPVYGYRFEGDRMIPDPEEQANVDRMMQMHNEGLSCYKIAVLLNEEGVKPRGSKWHPNTVKRALDWRNEMQARD
ncbi:MAG: recombinase family protein [Phycisphaerales bacterium]